MSFIFKDNSPILLDFNTKIVEWTFNYGLFNKDKMVLNNNYINDRFNIPENLLVEENQLSFLKDFNDYKLIRRNCDYFIRLPFYSLNNNCIFCKYLDKICNCPNEIVIINLKTILDILIAFEYFKDCKDNIRLETLNFHKYLYDFLTIENPKLYKDDTNKLFKIGLSILIFMIRLYKNIKDENRKKSYIYYISIYLTKLILISINSDYILLNIFLINNFLKYCENNYFLIFFRYLNILKFSLYNIIKCNEEASIDKNYINDKFLKSIISIFLNKYLKKHRNPYYKTFTYNSNIIKFYFVKRIFINSLFELIQDKEDICLLLNEETKILLKNPINLPSILYDMLYFDVKDDKNYFLSNDFIDKFINEFKFIDFEDIDFLKEYQINENIKYIIDKKMNKLEDLINTIFELTFNKIPLNITDNYMILVEKSFKTILQYFKNLFKNEKLEKIKMIRYIILMYYNLYLKINKDNLIQKNILINIFNKILNLYNDNLNILLNDMRYLIIKIYFNLKFKNPYYYKFCNK